MKLKILLFGLLLSCSSMVVNAQDAYIGEIRIFAGNYAPYGWMLCEGQTLPIQQNSALFSWIY